VALLATVGCGEDVDPPSESAARGPAVTSASPEGDGTRGGPAKPEPGRSDAAASGTGRPKATDDQEAPEQDRDRRAGPRAGDSARPQSAPAGWIEGGSREGSSGADSEQTGWPPIESGAEGSGPGPGWP
jgi:hypothetical protein